MEVTLFDLKILKLQTCFTFLQREDRWKPQDALTTALSLLFGSMKERGVIYSEIGSLVCECIHQKAQNICCAMSAHPINQKNSFHRYPDWKWRHRLTFLRSCQHHAAVTVSRE